MEWADGALTADIEALTAARRGGEVWLTGEQLPALAGGERFWGKRVLVPLGFRPDPDWPESALLAAAECGDDEALILTADGAEVLPRSAFAP